MSTIITCCGLFGVWLLFAGPVYQAALELRDHNMAYDHIATVRKSIVRKHTSWLWWLVPPVRMWLERRRSRAFAHAFLVALPNEHVGPLLAYLDKAAAWMFVAGGALLLAIKDTLVWVRSEGWPMWIGTTGCLVLFAICVGITATRTRATKRRIELYGPTPRSPLPLP